MKKKVNDISIFIIIFTAIMIVLLITRNVYHNYFMNSFMYYFRFIIEDAALIILPFVILRKKPGGAQMLLALALIISQWEYT